MIIAIPIKSNIFINNLNRCNNVCSYNFIWSSFFNVILFFSFNLFFTLFSEFKLIKLDELFGDESSPDSSSSSELVTSFFVSKELSSK